MPIPIYFRRILTPWTFLSSRYGRLGMGFCTSQKYSSTSRKIDVRTIGFEPAFTVGTSDSDPPLYDHGYLGEAQKKKISATYEIDTALRKTAIR